MAILYFSDALRKVGLDPKKVMLIRHALSDEGFKSCADAGMIREYTSHQKTDFAKGYEYWCVFVSGKGTLAKLYAIYKVGKHGSDTPDAVPKGMLEIEAEHFLGNDALFQLEQVDYLKEYENKLVIDWGGATRSWYQKGTTEKPIISIQQDEKKIFNGYENLVLTYDQLKEIVENETVYSAWHVALKAVYAIYLIVDAETGKQYVGSAYNSDGLFGRWSCYVATKHGNNKLMKDELCKQPERYHAFQFSILQILPKSITDKEVIKTESKWKEKLLSTKFGMNDK
jgi:hypothetical protein